MRSNALLLSLLVSAPAALAFSNINTEVDFQFIPATSTTPGGYFDVCPLNSYIERNPPVGPMNITNCGCPAGYTLRPTARSEGTSDNSLPALGGGLQCKQNNELACVDCEHYVRSTAEEKLATLWDHIMSSPLIEPNNPDLIGKNIKWQASEPESSANNQKIYSGLCNSKVANCVYLSSLTMTNSSGFGLPTDSVESTTTFDKQFWAKGRTGRETFPRFTSLYTESMDASFDRYADVLPKGRVKAIHNHGVVTKVQFKVNPTAKIYDQRSKTLKPASGFFATGSDNCILRSSISHPINTTCNSGTYDETDQNGTPTGKKIDNCANNGLLASTALKCMRDGTYSANILGLQDARGQGKNANWFHTQLKNWVPSYNPSMPSFGGVGPNAERFGTSTDDPLRMSLDQFSVAGEDGTEDISGISQPEILYWVPNGCMKGNLDTTTQLYNNTDGCVPFDNSGDPTKNSNNNWIFKNPYQNNDKSTSEYDFRDDLMNMPPGLIAFDLYAPSSTEGSCYCTSLGKNLYGWGYHIGKTGQPCPVINSDDPDLMCPPSKYPFVKVAQIVTTSPTVMSGWSDTQMFFQHGRYGKKENRVCRFDNAIPNDNKGIVHPARFSYDHHLACVAGQQCPDGSHEVNLMEAQPPLPNGHPRIKGTFNPAVGCPFANALLPSSSGLAGEAYPRPLPKGNCPKADASECEKFKCPEHSFATRLNPQSSAHCDCFQGYDWNADKNGCIPTGPYTTYNPVGLSGFFGFEVSVPENGMEVAIEFWAKFGFKKTGEPQYSTLPNNKSIQRQLIRMPIDKSGAAIAIELAEMQGSLAPTTAGVDSAYYGYEQISFSVKDVNAARLQLMALGVKNNGNALKPAKQNQRMGFASVTFTDAHGNKFEVVEDNFGGNLGIASTSPYFQSFWDSDVPTQPLMTTVAQSDFNPVGLGGIRAIHELVPETSAAQIWQMDTLNMSLWQFEAPELEALAENFNDCYQNPQLRTSVKKCVEAARLFPSATVGLGQMRVVYTFKGNANAGFVNSSSKRGSFIRPPPPYHNAYHGVSHVSYQVDLLDRSMQALAKSDVEIISPEYSLGNFGYKSVYFATNSKAYVKLVQPNFRAGSSVATPSPFGQTEGTPQFVNGETPAATTTAAPVTTTAPAANTKTSDGYRQATIALAVVMALLVTSSLAVVYARRRQSNPTHRWKTGPSYSTKRESSASLKTPASESSSSDVNVEMGSVGANIDQSAAAQQNPAYE